MRTRILSSELLRALHDKPAEQQPSVAAALNKLNRLAGQVRRMRAQVLNIANTPSLREQHDTREIRRAVLDASYRPVELPLPSVPKLDKRAARAQLRETNKWGTWHELAKTRKAVLDKMLVEAHAAIDAGIRDVGGTPPTREAALDALAAEAQTLGLYPDTPKETTNG